MLELDSLMKRWSHESPPLSALAAMDAIARLGSFAEAAKELNRTPSAVSHAIRDIEKKFGVELFQRIGRQVVLTQIGQLYAKDVEHAIDAVKRSNRTLKLHADEPTIRISAPPLIVATLLIPNMASFEAENKPYKLKIETTNQIMSLDSGDVDIGLRFVRDIDPNVHSTPLPRVWGAPVGAPSYLQQKKIKQGKHLNRADLIEVVQAPNSWARYFRHISVPMPDKQKFIRFDSTISALEAARQGLGVALGLFPLVGAYPGYGTELVKIPSEPLEYPYSYQLVCQLTAAELPKIEAFKVWLTDTLIEMKDRYASP